MPPGSGGGCLRNQLGAAWRDLVVSWPSGNWPVSLISEKMGRMTMTMRAISVQRAGGPEVLTEVEVPRPEPGPVEILVRVHAAGVNPTDWKSRGRGQTFGAAAPYVPGYDVSGVVEAVGRGVQLYRPGDEVFGMPLFPKPAGAYAEYV